MEAHCHHAHWIDVLCLTSKAFCNDLAAELEDVGLGLCFFPAPCDPDCGHKIVQVLWAGRGGSSVHEMSVFVSVIMLCKCKTCFFWLSGN